jgi:outer membrane protein TolC
VDVQHATGVPVDELGPEDAHEPGEDDEPSWPWRHQAAERRVDAEQQALARQVLQHVQNVRTQWVLAVADQQRLSYQANVLRAGTTAAELARRMQQAGHFSAAQAARHEVSEAQARLAQAQAERRARKSHERLVRLLGLESPDRLQLPDRLPDLPAALPALPDVEQQAMDARIDLQAARIQTEAVAQHLGLSRRTRVINVLELGVINNGSNEEPQQRGYEIRLELPLFDWGQTRVAAAESRYRQALEQVRQLAVDARSEVREAYAVQAAQYAIARHLRDEVVPLKQRISEENLLRYNGMLIGVFELLADARAQIAAVNATIDAQRDFWLADADLALALAGKPALQPIASAGPAMAESGGAH